MRHQSDVLIGLDAGSAAVVAAAFDRAGRQIAHAAIANPASLIEDGGVEQDLGATWQASVRTLRLLAEQVPDLARRTAALALTGQADGTWLVDEDGDPVAPALLGSDRRSAALVARWRSSAIGPALEALTGSRVTAGTQSAQLAWLIEQRPTVVVQAASVLHAKDWLYLCCTGKHATEMSQAVPAWGDFRTGTYDDEVRRLIGLEELAPLLPELVDGTRHHAQLRDAAAAATGLWSGTPVVLGPVDVIAAALASGLYGAGPALGCTLLGPDGAHLRLHHEPVSIRLPEQHAGGTVPFVAPGMWASHVAHPAAASNLDWLLGLCEELLAEAGLIGIARAELIGMLDRKAAQAEPGAVLFHPFLAESGSRGPSLGAAGCGQLHGLSARTTFRDLSRAGYEGLGFAARDAYAALDHRPQEIRLAGELARRATCGQVLGACVGAPVRRVDRAQPALAGAALVASVALGQYAGIEQALAEWVEPWLGVAEKVDPALEVLYDRLFEVYRLAQGQGAAIERALTAATG